MANPYQSQPTQLQLMRRAQYAIAAQNKLFLELVDDGMTREELRINIRRRPELWERFSDWLDRLPSEEA